MERMFTVKELAEILQMSERWIQLKLASKELPHIKFGSSVRIPESEVNKFIESRKVASK